MSNYILLSLCILFLNKTSLRIIKADIYIYIYVLGQLPFILNSSLHTQKERQGKGKITKKSLKGQRDRLRPLYQIKSALAGLFWAPPSLLTIALFYKAVTICEILCFREKMIKMKELLTPLPPTLWIIHFPYLNHSLLQYLSHSGPKPCTV